MEHAHDGFGELENEDTKWVVVTNLDDSIDDYDIREKFEKFGHVPLIEVPYNVDVPNRNGSSWGRCARIKFALAPAARAACSKLGGRPWRGKRIQAYTFDRWLKMVDKNKLKNQKMVEVVVPNKVFVGGLGPVNAHAMRRYFQTYGPIDTRQSKVIQERNGKSKGFGFVVFENADAAKMVLSQQLHWIQGRQVNVGHVREKKYVPVDPADIQPEERESESKKEKEKSEKKRKRKRSRSRSYSKSGSSSSGSSSSSSTRSSRSSKSKSSRSRSRSRSRSKSKSKSPKPKVVIDPSLLPKTGEDDFVDPSDLKEDLESYKKNAAQQFEAIVEKETKAKTLAQRRAERRARWKKKG